MKRALIAAAILIAFVASANAQTSTGAPPPQVQTTAVPADHPQGIGTPIGVPVAIVQQPAAQISAGSLSGDVLTWLAAVFGAPIAGFVVLWVKALAKKAGIEVSQAASDKLNDILERGINAGAAKASVDLAGKMPVDVQNKVLADAINYAKVHGADTIKDLAKSNNGTFGFLKSYDPTDPKVEDALAARATAALNKLSPDTVIEKSALPSATPAPPPAPPVVTSTASEKPVEETKPQA